MTKDPAVIVIGASAGGVDALRFLAGALPANFQAVVLVVLHIGSHESQLPSLLNHTGSLRAVHPRSGDPIKPGYIYVAPPDHHLVVQPGCLRLTKGPRENWARPAIDPLFRSAAQSYGSDVIGVILTGGLNDGTAGLYEIKECGGITVVQDPSDAAYPSMPRSALEHVSIDHCLPLSQLPELLIRLADVPARLRLDRVAPTTAAQGKEMTAEYKHDQPVAVTCPDCGGALRQTELGTLSQFRCHIGHVYTAEVVVAAQFAALEGSLEAAMRSFGERRELCRQMLEKSRTAKNPIAEAEWETARRDVEERTALLRQLLEKEWTHPDGIEI